MNSEHLIRMANQIGVFFESMPDRQEALEGIANHLKKFWEPRMRAAFLELLDTDATRIKPIVREAMQTYRAMLA
jgi:formate dehydrogenase subunit delta